MNEMSFSGRRPSRALATLALAGVAALAACDFGDPTDVQNPATTIEDLAEASEPTRSLLPGLRAQFARAMAATSVVTSVVSDDYSIHGTGIEKDWDFPADILPTLNNSTGDRTGIYWNIQELRSLASFVIEEVAPDDPDATPAQVATAHFWRGLAAVMLAENFAAAPLEREGPPVPAQQILDRAVADLNQARQGGDSETVLAATAVLARAQRLKGNIPEATTAAQQALTADPAFVLEQGYDASTLDNEVWQVMTIRALQEMQPLPRLDFLDPKFHLRTSPIVYAKAEEMYLILAEAAFAQGDFATGRTHLANAIDVASSREKVVFGDDDLRLNADLSIRPRDDEIRIRADANSPFRSGLVLDRLNPVLIPPTSDTSLDPDSIRGIPATNQQALLHALYLARQEIMLAEGRRLADLGIRLPVMQREIDANTTLSLGDPGTTVTMPSYIPPFDQMDLFTPASPYSGEGSDAVLVTDEITIMFDMNRILAQNRAPFQPIN